MTTATTTLVIGATGTTGSRTAAQLTAAGHHVKAASRRATPVADAESVPFDWYDPATYAAALDGVDQVYLIPPLGDSDPAATMLPFLHQARTAGVHRAVLLSSSAIPEGGPGVGKVHQALPDIFDQWAVLRPSWFMQNFTGTHAHAGSIRDEGIIWTATVCPTSRCATASRRRCRWSSPRCWPAWTLPSPKGRRTASPTRSSASPAGPRAPSVPSSRRRCGAAADVDEADGDEAESCGLCRSRPVGHSHPVRFPG